MVGSEFDVHTRAWIHPAIYKWFRLVVKKAEMRSRHTFDLLFQTKYHFNDFNAPRVLLQTIEIHLWPQWLHPVMGNFSRKHHGRKLKKGTFPLDDLFLEHVMSSHEFAKLKRPLVFGRTGCAVDKRCYKWKYGPKSMKNISSTLLNLWQKLWLFYR